LTERSIPLAADTDELTAKADRKLSRGIVEEMVGFRFRRIQNEIGRRFKQRISRAEVNTGTFSALALIDANPGLSQSELASEIGMDRATIVALLDALETNGWARRTRDKADRRRHSLGITPAGRKELARLAALALQNEEVLRRAVGPAGLKELFVLLDRIDKALAEEA
jgi:DNA-binding MarR family transcriptional regulator